MITSEVLDHVERRRPQWISEQIDRFFAYLAHRGVSIGEQIPWNPLFTREGDPQQLLAWTGCWDGNQLADFLDLLAEEHLLQRNADTVLWLTIRGYLRLEEAQRGNQDSPQAFVAMWFDQSLADAYDDGIAPAIRRAGFMPLRIDRKDHNGKIDDEIIAEIRRSRFVVADFTCGLIVPSTGQRIAVQRGGVYYEAGFAMGLGIPVIWSCHATQIKDVHFDTRQFAHITWSTAPELGEKLYNRVRATIPGAMDGPVAG